jgi:ribosomal protein S18 acetylase RimI-like enzyme
MANTMKVIPLTMVRDHLDQIPSFGCPAGYTIRTFRPGDDQRWVRVEALAGEFASQEEALREFHEEFDPHASELDDRCFLIEDSQGTVIGTAMAWYGDFAGEVRGRVHWVGIEPAYQGRGLAKPLLSTVLDRLARTHRAAFLTTQTTSYRAINLYLNFGFLPYLTGAADVEGWRMMEDILRRIMPEER